MLDFDQAQTLLANAAGPLQRTEHVDLTQASGRVLAADLDATVDIPPADNSAMDGYALRLADWSLDARLPIQQRCYAGDVPEPLKPGHAIRLFTGSVIPEGADVVVMQEDATEADNLVQISREPKPGQHIRRRGEDTRAGSPLLPAGTLLHAAHVALLASQGLASIPVFAQLRVGILTTGDELVQPGQPRATEQIYNSNGPMLAAMVRGMSALPVHVLHARDTETDLLAAFKTLLADCDLVLSVGGVSVGERDLVKPALAALGGELSLWKVRMKPGKPVALAQIDGKPVVSLPGNPVSAYAVFATLVTPLMRRMQGRAEIFPPVSQLRLRTAQPRQDAREEFLRVQCRVADDGGSELTPYGHQGSGVISSLPWSTGLARLPADVLVHDQDQVAYYDLRHWLA
ncbi:gephyrin-like molybdotransferase Glp [Achromobacter arsenitoxydans]|uniref:Molybdopterin molybdenumtransferase n=1 Tax=Achromobacter arsenitoxydans SY8 TaxID=477184 RepID=H0FDW9_9BURK|nr:gephyrin-like molybdotransferase Glp [Achromobacter arsenitoxydans]EHK63491.1 molybdopterin biosynthesis protein MoeA [Achromobacter arsenitoxydans SY8]